MAKGTRKGQRTRPTDKQIAEAGKLDDDALLDLAARAMHALNRRAKEKRDRRYEYRRCRFADAIQAEIDVIYDLKDAFLAAAVTANVAQVERFARNANMHCWTECGCGWTWGPGGGICRQCGDEGYERTHREKSKEKWYLVRLGDFSFHVPGPRAAPTFAKASKPGKPHDPAQPAREIPKVGLTIEAQHRVVKLAIERLQGQVEAVAAK